MPFYRLSNTETNTYVCTIQGELEEIYKFYKEQEGKYSLENLNIINKNSEDDYCLKLYHIVDNNDYYLLADNMEDAKNTYYIYCCARLRKPNVSKIIRKRFLRCLTENDEIILAIE